MLYKVPRFTSSKTFNTASCFLKKIASIRKLQVKFCKHNKNYVKLCNHMCIIFLVYYIHNFGFDYFEYDDRFFLFKHPLLHHLNNATQI